MSESGLVGGNAASPLSLREALTEACPVYMEMGMTYHEYWHGETGIHTAYREAHKRKLHQQNTMMWIQGHYIYDAICCASPILSARSKAKNPIPYPKEPYDLTDEDKEKRKEREARERYERIKEKVTVFAETFNKENAKKRGKEVSIDGENGDAGISN